MLVRSALQLNEEEGEGGMENAAFGPSPTTSTPRLTEAEAAGVYVQPLAEGQESSGPTQKPLPLCVQAHEDHPCGRGVCAFDHDLKPTFAHSKGYDYWEICRNGRRKGYLRIKDNAKFYWHHSQSLASRIFKAAMGTISMGSAVVVVGLCAEATDGLGAMHCAIAMGGPWVAGGLMWASAVE